MSEKYEPGTVAAATVRGVPNQHVYKFSDFTGWFTSDRIHGTRLHTPPHVTDIRPLVVLDLPTFEFGAKQLVDDLHHCATRTGATVDHGSALWHFLQAIRDQIEQQTRPPKPPEPTGLGAVVEDAEGERWVRFHTFEDGEHWAAGGPNVEANHRYSEIDAVRVLSEGVTN